MATISDALALAWQHYQAGAVARAEQLYRQVLQTDPANAHVWGMLGVMCHLQRKPADAVAAYQQAIRLQPQYAPPYCNLGITLRELGRLDEAIASYQQAIRLDPSNAAAHNNLGNALLARGRLEEAANALQEALRLKPDYVEAHNNLGNVYRDLGRSADALTSIENALRLRPDYPEARFNRAIEWLRQGDFERGWPEYEWRWKYKEFVPRQFAQPAWDGSPLNGRRILLYAEQGLGDAIQFVRYAKLAHECGGQVIVECPKALHPLLRTCPGVDELAVAGCPSPPFDVHAALLGLPGIFRTTLATAPANVPYLSADPQLVEKWGRELRPLDGFKIGINWQGNPSQRVDQFRSFALHHFASLGKVPGVRFFSLQKGPGTEQLQKVADRLTVTDLGSRLDEGAGAFMDTAAVMHHLDLVISACTSIAHVAGALGVAVWVPLSYAADFRWMKNRADSPWYPSMRLFRQTQLGRWQDVFDRIAWEVSQLIDAKSGIRG